MFEDSQKSSGSRLMADILAQGENLESVIRHLYTGERRSLETAAASMKNNRPVALIGMASSAYLYMPAEMYLRQRGRFASVLNAAEAVYFLLPFLKDANVVIVSRSGETAEIVRLAEALVVQGTAFIAVTNEPESTLAKLSGAVVWVNTRKDALVSINVVTGLMAAVMALAAALVGELDVLRPDFDRLANEMPAVVQQAARQKAALHALFEGIRPLHLLYRGYDGGAANCGRLVLEEIARTPGVVLEAAEFRQGPNEVVDERFGAALFIGRGRARALNLALAEDILRSGGRVLLIGGSERPIPHPYALSFFLPDLHEALRPALEIVPLQFLAYALAQAQGYEPGTVRYISKVIRSEAGQPAEDQDCSG